MRRYMLVVKATPEFEAGTFPNQAFNEEAAKFINDVANAGALVACDRLQPSSQGVRVRYKNDQLTVTDGPFAETKELVAGAALFSLRTSPTSCTPRGPTAARPSHQARQSRCVARSALVFRMRNISCTFRLWS